MNRTQIFQFKPKWKEELIITGPGGSFVVEMPMGRLSVYLPEEVSFIIKAPHWAKDLWTELKLELEQWCISNDAILCIESNAWLELL